MLRSIALSSLAHPLLARMLWRLRRGHTVVVMMHRFANDDSSHGHNLTGLRVLLQYLRSCDVRLESIDTFMSRSVAETGEADRSARPAVVFTVDDGYADFGVAQPVFAEFDCPVTVFVAPEVVDGRHVFWWDQVRWLMQRTRQPQLSLHMPGGISHTVRWHDGASRDAARVDIEERLKLLSTDDMVETLKQFSVEAHVPLLNDQPAGSAVLTWDQMRSLELRGVQFGAHTMTHPVLARCDDRKASWEITASLARLRSELQNPSHVFCYPNGRACDFGEREVRTVANSGVLGAVSAEPGIATAPQSAADRSSWRWRVPRVSYDSRPGVLLREYFD